MGAGSVEFLLQWADELDDLMGAAAQLLVGSSYRLAAFAGVLTAAFTGAAIGLGVGAVWG